MRTQGKDPSVLSFDEARYWASVGVMAAFALVMSYVETFIPVPVPIPGVKLGLANAVILAALLCMDFRSAFCVALAKVLVAGFLFGSPVMIAYSAVGTVFATLAMGAIAKIPGVHPIPVAMVGAVCHNIGQLLVASALLGTGLVWFSAPILFCAACATGALTGALAKGLADAFREESLASAVRSAGAGACAGSGSVAAAGGAVSAGGAGGVAAFGSAGAVAAAVGVASAAWGADVARCACEAAGGVSVGAARGFKGAGRAAANDACAVSGFEASADAVPSSANADVRFVSIDTRVKLFCFILYAIVLFKAENPVVLALCVLFAGAFAGVVHVSPKEVLAALKPLGVILIITLVAQVLYCQSGTVLFEVHEFPVYAEAVFTAVFMIARLVCLMVASLAFMHCVSSKPLIDTLSWFLRPLRRLGVRTDAFMLMLDVAFSLLPFLMAEARVLMAGDVDGQGKGPSTGDGDALDRKGEGSATEGEGAAAGAQGKGSTTEGDGVVVGTQEERLSFRGRARAALDRCKAVLLRLFRESFSYVDALAETFVAKGT